MVCSKIYISNREKSGEQPLYESEFTVQSVEKIREVKSNPKDPQLIDPYDYKYTGVLSSGKAYSITVNSEGKFKVGETYKVYSPDNKAWRTNKAFDIFVNKSIGGGSINKWYLLLLLYLRHIKQLPAPWL